MVNAVNEHISGLLALIEHFCLKERALEGCKKALINCDEDYRESCMSQLSDWAIDEIILCFDKCMVTLEHELIEYPYFDTQIGLYIKDDSGVMLRDLNDIGKYHLYTTLQGDDFDDCLIINVVKDS